MRRAVLLALVAACARVPVLPPVPPPAAVEASAQAAREAWAAVRQRASAVRTMSGEARLVVSAPEGGGKVTALVAAACPDRVRIDLVTLFGPLRAMAVDGAAVRVVDYDARRVLDAADDRSPWERVVGVAVETRELVALVCGGVPVVEGAEAVRLEEAGERRVLTVAGPTGAVLSIELEAATGRALSAATAAWTARFEGHDGPLDLPSRVRVEAHDGRRSLELRWKTREVNLPVEASRLRLGVPEGFAGGR